jgi:hypothetical protein
MRTDQGFVREIYQGIKATVPLACIQTNLALAEIYEGWNSFQKQNIHRELHRSECPA